MVDAELNEEFDDAEVLDDGEEELERELELESEESWREVDCDGEVAEECC